MAKTYRYIVIFLCLFSLRSEAHFGNGLLLTDFLFEQSIGEAKIAKYGNNSAAARGFRYGFGLEFMRVDKNFSAELMLRTIKTDLGKRNEYGFMLKTFRNWNLSADDNARILQIGLGAGAMSTHGFTTPRYVELNIEPFVRYLHNFHLFGINMGAFVSVGAAYSPAQWSTDKDKTVSAAFKKAAAVRGVFRLGLAFNL